MIDKSANMCQFVYDITSCLHIDEKRTRHLGDSNVAVVVAAYTRYNYRRFTLVGFDNVLLSYQDIPNAYQITEKGIGVFENKLRVTYKNYLGNTYYKKFTSPLEIYLGKR